MYLILPNWYKCQVMLCIANKAFTQLSDSLARALFFLRIESVKLIYRAKRSEVILKVSTWRYHRPSYTVSADSFTLAVDGQDETT